MKRIIIILALLIIGCKAKTNAIVAPDVPADAVLDNRNGVMGFPVDQEEVIVEDIIVVDDVGDRVVDNLNLVASSERVREPAIDALQEMAVINPIETEADIVPKDVGFLEDGRLVYEVPSEMIKFQEYMIRVRINRDLRDTTIYEDIENPTEDTAIRTSEKMMVELKDPTELNFHISASKEEQFVEVTGFTTWTFYVTPLRKGPSKLILTVSIMKDGTPKEEVHSKTIQVETTAWIEIENFVMNYWQWLAGFFGVSAVPLYRWVANLRRKRGENTLS